MAGYDAAVTSFGILGKALITITYSSGYIMTSETYPTDIRAVGMGVATSFARFSSLFASFAGGIMVCSYLLVFTVVLLLYHRVWFLLVSFIFNIQPDN